MSYILDALRRADSERERGAVPSLHSKPVPVALSDPDDEASGQRPQLMLWAIIGLLLLLVVVLAWQFVGSRAPEPAVVSAAPPVAPPVATMPPVSPEPVPPPLQPEPSPPGVAVAPRAVAPKVPAQRKPQREVPKTPMPASATERERPVIGYNDLPDNIRRELPQLIVGGAMYSQTRANRMLILNGQVFHEGDKVTGELTLEQIKLKSAVLAYKGYRYGINY